MSVLILPSRFRSQPQYAAQLDRRSPYFPNISFAWSAGRGLLDGAHPGCVGAFSGSMSYGTGAFGRSVKTNDSSSFLQFASIDDYNILGELTVVARIRTGDLGYQQTIVIKTESGGGTQTPYGLLIEYDGSLSFNRSNSSGGTSFRVWASSVKLSANTDYVIAVSQQADMSVAPIFYVNGVRDTGAAISLYGGSGSGAPTATTQPLKLGNRTDLASPFPGEIRDVLVLAVVLSPHGAARLSENIDQIWQPRPRKIFDVSAGGTTYDLVGANAAQENSASAAAITQSHALTGSGAAQANAASIGAITQTHALTGAASAQANAAATGAVAQTHALSGSASSQANAATSGAISQGAQFAADPVTQPNIASAGAITQAHALTGAGSAQSQTASAASITQAHVLTGVGSTQANTSPSAAISTGVVHNLAASQSTQANTDSTSAITQAHVLVLAPSVQDNIAAASAIVQAHVLAASSATQSNSASSGAITAGDNVLVSIVERTATFRRSKSVTVRFN